MPANFAALENTLSCAIDHMFGESFRFLPMTQATVNSRLAPDTTRDSAEIRAVLDDRNPGSTSFERLGRSSGGIASKSQTPQFATSNPMLFVDERQFFPAAMPARRLDRIKRTETGDVYEITGLEKDGQGRWKIGLVKVAKEDAEAPL